MNAEHLFPRYPFRHETRNVLSARLYFDFTLQTIHTSIYSFSNCLLRYLDGRVDEL